MFRMLFSLGLVGMLALSPQLASGQGAAAPQDGQSPLDSPFLAEPKTPEELFEAARIAAQLARPALARQYLDQLLQVADDATLLQLREKFGPGEFLRLAAIRSLHPSSRTLLDRTNAAFRTQAEDPSRVAELVRALSGSASERAVAVESLRSAGPSVVAALFAILTDNSAADLHESASLALTRLTRDAVPAVLGGINAPNTTIRSAALVALGHLGDRSVVPFLWRPAFAPGEPAGVRSAARRSLQRLLAGSKNAPKEVSNFGAADLLYQTALQHFGGSFGWDADEDGNVAIWEFVDGKLTRLVVSTAEASQQVGTRLSRDAMELAPGDTTKQTLYLAFLLAAGSRQVGWEQPLPAGPGTAHDVALSVGPNLLADALTLSLQHDHRDAARGALAAIWQVGRHDLLQSTGSGPSPLMAALTHPDPRIQFAAANSILSLTPTVPFAGSSHVVGVLSRALRSDATVACLVIDPNNGRANTVAGLLSDLGYSARTATTGRDGFRIAAESGDVTLIAVNANTVRWALTETVANLRADSRTAGIPIVIYGPDYVRPRIANLLDQFAHITFMEEPAEGGEPAQKFVTLSLKPFIESVAPGLTEAELIARKSVAAGWFGQLSGPRRTSPLDLSPALDALIEAVRDEAVATQCITGLGAIPTARVQKELYAAAIDETMPEQTRAAAMNELTFHIQRHGVMLGASEQVDLVRLADAVAATPLSTSAAALAGVLGPDARVSFERLRRYQP